MLVPGRSRELLDPDSLEDNIGRPAPVGNRGDADYDGRTRFSKFKQITFFPRIML